MFKTSLHPLAFFAASMASVKPASRRPGGGPRPTAAAEAPRAAETRLTVTGRR